MSIFQSFLDDLENAREEEEEEEEEEAVVKDSPGQLNILQALKHPKMAFRDFCLCFIWFLHVQNILQKYQIMRCLPRMTSSLAYYGVWYSMGSFSGDIFVNNLISAATEIPGYAAITPIVAVSGRRGQAATLFIPAACFLLIPFLSPGSGWVFAAAMVRRFIHSPTLTVAKELKVGKTAVTTAFGLVYVMSSQLHPTPIRTSGLTLGSLVCRFGSMTAPYVVLVARIDARLVWMPSLVFGVISLVAGCLALLLPEISNRPMPETLADVLQGSFFLNRKLNTPPKSQEAVCLNPAKA